MTRRQLNVRLPDTTIRQLAELAEHYESQAHVIMTAIDRMYQKEIGMTIKTLDESEIEEFQDLILKTPDCPGAQSFPLQDHYEVHPRGEAGTDFPEPVQTWLREHGFERAVDRQRGPFYYR